MTKEEMDRGFYVTPDRLIDRMIEKLDEERTSWKLKVLEPSAGDGAIIERMKNSRYDFRDISAIEIDETRQAILLGKGFKLIDTDFLSYHGPDKFDLIIANPPFDHGDVHLLKAIDIMYCGEIVFLLNAETIRNPCTSTRRELARRLKELEADIEYIQNAFADAERPTGVEVALIHINIKRDVEDDLFAGAGDKADDPKDHGNVRC